MADDTDTGSQSLLQGNAFASALANQNRKTAAYNALNKVYGPGVAGDPEAAQQAATAAVTQANVPAAEAANAAKAAALQSSTEQYGAQAGNPEAFSSNVTASTAQSQQLREQGYRAAGQLIGLAGPDGAIPGDEFDKTIGAHPTQYGLDPNMVAAFRAKATAPGGAQFLGNLQKQLIGPTQVAGTPIVAAGPGGSQLIQKDKYGNLINTSLAPGVTPVSQERIPIAQQNANTNAAKIPILQQNANTSGVNANTRVSNSVFGDQGGPANQGGGTKTAPAAAPAAGQPVVPPAIARLPLKGQEQVRSQAQQLTNQITNLQTTNTLLDTALKQVTPFTAGAGSLLKDMPGSAQTDLKANLATLKSQGLMTWIAGMKNAQGQTGIGRVLQSEANAAQSLFGNMEQDQSAKQLAFHMGLFKQTVNNLVKHSQDNFTAQWQTDPWSAIGEKAPNSPPSDAATAAAYKKYGIQ